MTGQEIVVFIISVLSGLALLRVIFLNMYRFFKVRVMHKDIAIKVLNHQVKERSFNTRMKIAYTGAGRDIIRDILFTYRLRLPAPFDRFLAYVNIASAYLTCDMCGLTTLLGTEYYRTMPLMVHIWKVPRVIKYPISVVNGIFFFYVTFLMLVIPIVGWIFLNWGPYGKFSLDSLSERMRIVNGEGKNIQLPIVLNPGTELTLEIQCKMGLKAKGFKIGTPYRILNRFPPRTFCAPKPGRFAWVGRGTINLCLGDKWNRLPTELGERLIIGIGRH